MNGDPLETINHLLTESFVLALRILMAIERQTRTILSDNAKNFIFWATFSNAETNVQSN